MQIHVKKSQIRLYRLTSKEESKPIYVHPPLRKEKNTALGCVI